MLSNLTGSVTKTLVPSGKVSSSKTFNSSKSKESILSNLTPLIPELRANTVMYVKDLETSDLTTPQVLGAVFTSDCSDSLKCDIIVCDLSDDTHNDQCKADPQIIESRAQINVVLGEDFKSRF